MNLAFFVTRYPVPSQTFITDQVAALIARGHQVTIVSVDQGEGSIDPRVDSAQMVFLRPPGARRSRAIPRLMLRALCGSYQLRKAIAALKALVQGLPEVALDLAAYSGSTLGQFDAIVCHFGPAGVRAAAMRRAGVFDGPICTVFHGYDVSRKAALKRFLPHYRKLFRDTELFLPVSDLWRRRLIEWGAKPDKTVVHHMGVDLDRIANQALDRPIERPLRVLSVARLVEKKGINIAIDGVRRAKVAVEYTIIGSGSEEVTLRAQASGSHNQIRFLGRQPHSAVFAALAQSDVFLLPSVTASDGDMEGIPVALMEAMATGVLTVATRHSANHELVTHRESGLLVDEGSATAIAAALEQIGNGRLDVRAIRQAARTKVELEFDNAKLNGRLECLLRELKSN